MDYFLSVATLVGIYVILSTSFNLIIGYAGLVSIAHPAFFGLGAYVSGLVAVKTDLPILVAMLLGVAAAAVSSSIMASASLRVSGDYLLIASLGFQLAVIAVLTNLVITGGPSGLSGIPAIFESGNRDTMNFLLVWAVAAAVAVLVWLIARGPYGMALKAMRDNESAYSALGRNARRTKTVTMIVGSSLAGLAGCLYAFTYQYVTPDQLGIMTSGILLTMVVVGGMGTVWGPVIGAVLVQLIPQALTFLTLPPDISAGLQGVIFTSLVVVFLFLRPGGIASAVPTGQLRRKRPPLRRAEAVGGAR